MNFESLSLVALSSLSLSSLICLSPPPLLFISSFLPHTHSSPSHPCPSPSPPLSPLSLPLSSLSLPLSLSLQDPGGQQVGFLLGSLGVSVALTSEATAKALPKEEGKDHIILFKVLTPFMLRVCVCVCVCVCVLYSSRYTSSFQLCIHIYHSHASVLYTNSRAPFNSKRAMCVFTYS